MRWPDRNDVDGETEQLMYLVDNGWCWNWPGWNWIARNLNSEYANNRSAQGCRNKYYREENKIMVKKIIQHITNCST